MSFENFFNIRKLLGCFFGSYLLKFLQKKPNTKARKSNFQIFKKCDGSTFFLDEYGQEKSRKYYFVKFKIPRNIFGLFCNSVLWTLEVDTCIY